MIKVNTDRNKKADEEECCPASSCCNGKTDYCPEPETPRLNKDDAPWITGKVNSTMGPVPRVSSSLSAGDLLGNFKARSGLKRMNYKINPGLYAAGNPHKDSPVLVSANYKLSFDELRRHLDGLDLWIMVLDTGGINVWCAAGKGTFGTNELVSRIKQVGLSELLSHKSVILPQLAAPGVSAHEVKEKTGFRVIYGPVRSEDIPSFLKAGFKATPVMREVRFTFLNRLILTPMELAAVIKPVLLGLLLVFFFNLFQDLSAPFLTLVSRSLIDFIPYLGAVLTGAVMTPVLLPFIPGRALAVKGWLAGLIWAGFYGWFSPAVTGWEQFASYFLVLPPISAFLAMNFTGATTYTSLSGVVKEMRIALPAMIISVVAAILLGIARLFVDF